MKKVILLTVCIFIMSVFGCKNIEKEVINCDDQPQSAIRLSPLLCSKVSFGNGMFKFDDQQTFEKVLIALELEDQNWNDQF